MMGSSQHGHMSSVGYDLYCRMLEETIAKIRGDIEEEAFETTIEIKIDAYIPSGYIKDETQKIEVYKKIASISSDEELVEIEDEIEDRFSDIPPSVRNLINIAYLKSIANELGIVEIKEVKEKLDIKFINKEKLSRELIKKILSDYRGELAVKLGDEPVLYYNLKNIKKENLLERLIELFKEFLTIV